MRAIERTGDPPEIAGAGRDPEPHDRSVAKFGQSFCPRETEVAALVTNGLRNREIAAALNLAERTVKFWLARAFVKSGTSNRTELSRWFTGGTYATVGALPRRDPPNPPPRGSLAIIERELRNLSAGLRVDLSPIETVRQRTSQLLDRAAQLRRDCELEESGFLRRVTELEDERKQVQSALRDRVAELTRSIEHLKSRFLDERKESIAGGGQECLQNGT